MDRGESAPSTIDHDLPGGSSRRQFVKTAGAAAAVAAIGPAKHASALTASTLQNIAVAVVSLANPPVGFALAAAFGLHSSLKGEITAATMVSQGPGIGGTSADPHFPGRSDDVALKLGTTLGRLQHCTSNGLVAPSFSGTYTANDNFQWKKLVAAVRGDRKAGAAYAILHKNRAPVADRRSIMLWAYGYYNNDGSANSNGGDFFHIVPLSYYYAPQISGDGDFAAFYNQAMCTAVFGAARSDAWATWMVHACQNAGFRSYQIPGWSTIAVHGASRRGLQAGNRPSRTNGNPAWRSGNGIYTVLNAAYAMNQRIPVSVQSWMDWAINRATVRNIGLPSSMAIIWQIAIAAIRYGLSKSEIRAEVAEWLMVSGWAFEDMVFIVELIDDFFAGTGMSPSQLSAIMHVFLSEIQAGAPGHPARSVSSAVWNAIRADQPLATVKARYLEVFDAYSLWLDNLVPNGVFLTASGKIAVR
jgi:hypothetical protein